MTYTTLANGDQNNSSPWVPRALTAVGLGALAFASGTLYRNNNNNDVVVASTTNLVRGDGGENKVFHLGDVGPMADCPYKKEVNLEYKCECAEKYCKPEFKACREDNKTDCNDKIKKCFNKGKCENYVTCVNNMAKAGPIVPFQECLQQNCENC
mmetsp:Transcript_44380/g.50106  ORF Transcript_44380/g.50106 Transcript_44380/m.50106 type:complete len:154 (+) Transcript_44380:78-539(+)